MKALVPAVVILGSSMAIAAPATAQDLQISVTPYFWAAGIAGDVAPVPGLPTVHTESDFSEVLDTLQMGLASAMEVRAGRWAFVGDLSYVDTGVSAELPAGTPVFSDAGLDTKSLFGTAAASYRLSESADGDSFDVLAGLRVNWTDNDVRLMRPDGSQVKASDDETWFDPVVGVRAAAQLTERWGVVGYADVGGFGLSSDLTWQAMASVNYRLNDRFSVVVGYRYYAIDYDHDGFVFDVAQYGPLIGTTIRF
jgi:hypothetical protein